MIYAKDKGRMCNNILQFGHCYAWAREHGLKAVSMRFCYKYPGFRISHTPGHNYFVYLWAKYGSMARLVPVVSFDDPEAPQADTTRRLERLRRLARRPWGVVMAGWHVRHYDLFLKYRREITDLFAFDRPTPAAVTRCPGEVLLGVHIRRGDYDRWHGGRYFFTDDQYIAQIRRYAEIVAPQGRRVRVVLATNDPELDTERFRSMLADTVAAVDGPATSARGDLEALSMCDCIMGPPSTFSLVAAMYRDIPLRFITDTDTSFTLDDFSDFAHLFRYDY